MWRASGYAKSGVYSTMATVAKILNICVICATVVAGDASGSAYPPDPNFKGIDFFVPPNNGQGPSTPDDRPDNRLDPVNGPVPAPRK